MKKVFYIIAAITLFCGCHKMEEFDQPTLGGITGENLLPEVIYAYMADESQSSDSAETRTYVGEDGHSVLWHQGDEISFFVYKYHNVKLVNNSADGASAAELQPVSESDPDNSKFEVEAPKFVYPYNAGTACIENDGVETLVVNYPDKQTYALNSFGRGANLMVAASESADKINQIYFRNACGYLIIKLNGAGEKVKSIKLTALGDGDVKIAGKAHIVAHHDAAPEVTMTGEATSSITLNCGNGVELTAEDTEFWFALPPVTFKNGLEIEITDGDNNKVTKSTTKEVVVPRNQIQPMAAFTLHPKLYYTRATDITEPLTFRTETPFDAEISAHYYDEENSRFVIAFKTPVTKINNSAFSGGQNLPANDIATISIPSTVTTIGQYAFYDSKLTEITIPGTVNVIGHHAFDYCNELRSVTFLPSPTPKPLYLGSRSYVESISAFSGVPIETVHIDRNIFEGKVEGVDEVSYSTSKFNTYHSSTRITSVTLGEQVEQICDYMFDFAAITEINIPSSVTSIGVSAFEACRSLTSVTIPSSVTSVGDKAFYDCEALTSATLNNSTIGSDMFKDCDQLNKVIYGGTFSSINGKCFSGCSKLSELNITGSVTSIDNGAFDSFNITTIDISGYVGTIGANAFDDCDKLVTLNITGTVDTIGEHAFDDCDKLATVKVTGSVGTVGAYAFSDCDAVTSLAIKANIVEERAYEDMDGLKTATLYGATVGNGVFYDNNALEEVTITGGVNSIGNDAFYNCYNLKKVTFSSSTNALTIGYQPSLTDDVGTFYQSPLETIDLLREVVPSDEYKKQLDNWDMGIFTNKGGKKVTVLIGSNVKTICKYMFSSVGIENINIPSNITEIQDNAFHNCDGLLSVTCQSSTPPTLGANVFYSCDKLESIYVPSTAVSTYQSTGNWVNWTKYIKNK